MPEAAPESTEKHMHFLEHLEELRFRIIKCLLAIILVFPVTFHYSQPTIEWIKRELCPEELGTLINTEMMGLFILRMKMGTVMAMLICTPLLAYHIWKFIGPALLKQERKHVLNYVIASSFLFSMGAAFALFAIYPMVVRFSLSMSSEEVVNMISVQSFVMMAGMMMIGFGAMFQLPILVFLLIKTGIIKIETMRQFRPIVIVVIFVLAAVMTPPDIISQVALGLPAYIMFEGSMLLARLTMKKEDKAGE
jgi:sec-independent protein translocase protein TatC